MARKNTRLQQLITKGTYNVNVTSKVLKVVAEYQNAHPEKKIFMMGWGFTSQPLPPIVVQQLLKSSRNLGNLETYTSYEDVSGNPQLKEAICQYYLDTTKVSLHPSEVFINDGAQSALANILELFESDDIVALQNPWYPAVIEGTLLSGRTDFVELECNENNNFIPKPPAEKVDIIYLCFPNNPTGAVLNKDELQGFVNYARENRAVIIVDAVYSSFITTPNIPRSIYEVEGARECVIEIQSLSKIAGFGGVRLGWIVIPDALQISDSANGELQQMWNIRNAIKFWGASNLAQQAAIAALSKQGQKECDRIVNYYMENARLLQQGFAKVGFTCYGGKDAPYIWLKAAAGWDSRQLFDCLLSTVGVVGIPGNLFGSQGEGFIRLSTLGNRDEIKEVVKNLPKLSIFDF